MNTLLRKRPSPSMIISCIALLVALGGTSVAAVQALGPNTVGTIQLKANAVTTAKLKNGQVTNAKLSGNAVTGTKVRNGSLTKSDFAAGSLPVGPAGPAGPAGPSGAAGPTGASGTIGAITVRQESVAVPGGVAENGAYDTRTVTVNCLPNEKAISAGTSWSDDVDGRELWTQRLTPVLTGTNVTGFRGTGGNDSGNDSTFIVYALCYVG